jgi:hypothetical protein
VENLDDIKYEEEKVEEDEECSNLDDEYDMEEEDEDEEDAVEPVQVHETRLGQPVYGTKMGTNFD